MAFDWSPEARERLRTLWTEGHSTAEIGRRLGCTKNAVVGAAYRMDLPPRPNPMAESRRRAKELVAARAALGAGQPAEAVARSLGTDVGALTERLGEYQRALAPRRDVTLAPPASVGDAGGSPRPAPVVAAPPVRRRLVLPVSGVGAAAVRADDPNAERLAGVVFRPRAARPCAWPIGEPRSREFRTCDEPTSSGKPYCPEHCDAAYVRPRRSVDDVAGVAHAG